MIIIDLHPTSCLVFSFLRFLVVVLSLPSSSDAVTAVLFRTPFVDIWPVRSVGRSVDVSYAGTKEEKKEVKHTEQSGGGYKAGCKKKFVVVCLCLYLPESISFELSTPFLLLLLLLLLLVYR